MNQIKPAISYFAPSARRIALTRILVGVFILPLGYLLILRSASARSIWISSAIGTGTSVVREFSTSNGVLLSSFTVPADSVDGLAYDQIGSLWLLTEDGRQLLEYSREGNLSQGVSLSTLPDSLEGLTWLEGSFLIASPGSDQFIEVDTHGQILRAAPMGSTVDYAGLGANADTIFAAGGNQIAKLEPNTLAIDNAHSVAASGSIGLDFDGQWIWLNQGNLLVALDPVSFDQVTSFPIPEGFHEGIAAERVPEPSTVLGAIAGLTVAGLLSRRAGPKSQCRLEKER